VQIEVYCLLKERDMNATTMTLARYEAIKIVKAQLRASGLRLGSFEQRDITARARAYLSDHPELVQLAAHRIATTPSLRKLAEQEERARRAKLSTDAQAPKRCSASTIPVQISRSKWREECEALVTHAYQRMAKASKANSQR
jgi:hypothetical protein